MQNMRLIKNLLTLADSMPDQPTESSWIEEAADTIFNLEVELAAMRGAANSFKMAYNNLLAGKRVELCEYRERKTSDQDSSTV